MGSQSGKQEDAKSAEHAAYKKHKHDKYSEVDPNYHRSASSSDLPHFGTSGKGQGIEERRQFPELPEHRMIPLPDFGPEALKAVEQEVYLKQAVGEFTLDRDPDLRFRPPALVCRDPYFWTRKDDWLPNDPFREWRQPPQKEKKDVEDEKSLLSFFGSLAKAATTPIGEEGTSENTTKAKKPRETMLIAGPPLRHNQREERKVPMLPVHGPEEAYALPSPAPASAPICVGEIIHAPVLDIAAIADRASRPPSMVRPPPSMVLASGHYATTASAEPWLRSQVASSMVLSQGIPAVQQQQWSAPSYQGSWPSSAVRVY
jgi:hypothetical protein